MTPLDTTLFAALDRHEAGTEWADATTAGIVSHGPVTNRSGDVADWMRQRIQLADGRTAIVEARSLTRLATNLVFRVGQAVRP